LRHRCTVVPVASLGVDDAFDIAFDSGDLERSRLRRFYERYGIRRELVLPVPRRVTPQRIYFKFCEALPAQRYLSDDLPADDAALQLRDDAYHAVLQGLDFLREVRENDKERYPLARARKALSNATSALGRSLDGVFRKSVGK